MRSPHILLCTYCTNSKSHPFSLFQKVGRAVPCSAQADKVGRDGGPPGPPACAAGCNPLAATGAGLWARQ